MKRSASTKRSGRPSPRASRPRKRDARDSLSPEFRYLTENAKALEAYPGEVLLIHGYRLVAHSPDMEVIQKAIQDHKIRIPFIYWVPLEKESNFLSSFF